MNRLNRATREWLINHPAPKEARDFVCALVLNKDEEEILLRHTIGREPIEKIASEKNISYDVILRLHKKALKRATFARKNIAIKIK